MGDICSRVQGNDGRMELPTLTISAANGWMKQEDRFSGNIAGKEQTNYTLLHKGELSYNHGNSKLAKYGTVFSLQTYEEALVPRVYHSFKVENESADFIEYYFATKIPDRELRKLISSGARMDGLLNIGYDDFMGIKMMFPSASEQDKIAEYFRALDHIITLHQRKCDETKKLKKFMLQKMFPKKDAKKPEIRFAGFTDDWEQRKVREVTDRYDNLRIPVAASLRVAGTTPYYGANGIQDYVDGYTHDGEFILVAEDGANDLKNYPVKCVKGRIWVNNHAHVLQGKYDCADNQFLAYAISQADIESLLVGGGRAKLNAETLMGIDLLLPNKAEQIRIGKYLAQLDNLITLHQRKCDELKEFKKYMLQNMFPQKG